MSPARRASILAAIAIVATGANAVKPVHLDDAAYLRVAQHIIDDPLRPYDFVTIWYGAPQPAFQILAPPVLPYWLALCRVLSDEPTVWGWLQLPWLLILVISLDRLADRFLGGFRPWWLMAMVFSPVVLPGINFMLDIPALALGTASLAAILSAVDSGAIRRGMAAGLLLGLAMETKYTGATFAVAWLVLTPRPLASLRILGTGWLIAALFVVAVEIGIALSAGRSHLWFHVVAILGVPIPLRVDRLLGIGTHFALALPAATIFAWTALLRGRFPKRLRWLAVVGVVALASWLVRSGVAYMRSVDGVTDPVALDPMATTMIVGGFIGLVVPFVAGLRGGGQNGRLVLWLLVELGFSLFASPFPAMRRALGPTVSAWLLLWPGDDERPDAGWRRAAIVLSIGIALLYWRVDFTAAVAQREGAVAVAERYAPADGDLWFVGHWGWSYYAERQGMRVVMPGQTTLKAGDRLVIPDGILGQRVATNQLDPVERFVWPDSADGLPPPPRWGLGEYYFGSIPFSIATGHPFAATIYEARVDTDLDYLSPDR
ncbi:MAG: hypothetical protein ACE5FL_07615 [Myxococcota bacterium]